MTTIDKLLNQREALVLHLININKFVGQSANPEGAEIARKAIEDFDKTYGEIIKKNIENNFAK